MGCLGGSAGWDSDFFISVQGVILGLWDWAPSGTPCSAPLPPTPHTPPHLLPHVLSLSLPPPFSLNKNLCKKEKENHFMQKIIAEKQTVSTF